MEKTRQPALQHHIVLDGMRGVAAIGVMLFHYLIALDLRETTMGGRPVVWFGSGDVAVDFFFVLSGFVLAQAYADRLGRDLSAGGYLARRAIRLWPMHAVGIGLGAMAVGVPAVLAQGWTVLAPVAGTLVRGLLLIPAPTARYALDFAGLGDAGMLYPLNSPAWSLMCEMLVSGLFLLAWRWREGTVIAIAIGAFVVFVALQLQGWRSGMEHRLTFVGGATLATAHIGLLRALLGFMLGLWVWKVQRRGGMVRKRPYRPIVLYLVLLAFLATPVNARGATSVVFVFVVTPLLVHLGLGDARALSPTARRFGGWLGWISYPLYCVHLPVGQMTWLLGRQLGWSSWSIFWLAIALSLAIAALASRMIEQPLRRWFSARLLAG